MGDMEYISLEEDTILLTDAPPCRDNAKGFPKEKAHMNLKKAVDALYVGRLFKDKNELRKALCVYSIKRLYNFKITSSDRMRVITVCDDEKCIWRIYAKKHNN